MQKSGINRKNSSEKIFVNGKLAERQGRKARWLRLKGYAGAAADILSTLDSERRTK